MEEGRDQMLHVSSVTLGKKKHIKNNTLSYESGTSLKFTCCNMFIHPTWHYYQVNEASKRVVILTSTRNACGCGQTDLYDCLCVC